MDVRQHLRPLLILTSPYKNHWNTTRTECGWYVRSDLSFSLHGLYLSVEVASRYSLTYRYVACLLGPRSVLGPRRPSGLDYSFDPNWSLLACLRSLPPLTILHGFCSSSQCLSRRGQDLGPLKSRRKTPGHMATLPQPARARRGVVLKC
jgi:hypothetical protein